MYVLVLVDVGVFDRVGVGVKVVTLVGVGVFDCVGVGVKVLTLVDVGILVGDGVPDEEPETISCGA